MDWSKGFSASYYLAVVDPQSWRDISRIEMTGGKVSKMSTGLRNAADVTCTDFEQGKEYWVRIWMTATQGANSDAVPLFTGIASSASVNMDGNRRVYPVQCYSVLKPAQDVLLQRGWYAPAQTSADVLIRQLLAVCPAPLVIDAGIPYLHSSIVAGNGETHLSMVDRILTAIGWRMVLEGDGTIHVCKRASVVSASFDALENDVIEPRVELTRDWFNCPNVFRAIQEELTAVARDDSEDSFLSTVNRGREIWMEEDGCDFSDGETIGEYALRRLKEEQSVAVVVTYDRRFHPDINVTDLVRLVYPGQGIEGIYTVSSQDIELGYGAKVSEEVIM